MAEMPTQVTVGPHRYTVEENSTRMRAEHPDWAAMTKRHTLEIVLQETLGTRAREALWHEVKHAVADVIGWGYDEHLDEESAINRTAAMELAVLRENPVLVAYLLEPD